MNRPYFSVIIPALNEEKFLPNLLASLAAQTKRNFEVIVVDGHSDDKTVAVAHTFDTALPSLHITRSDKASLPLQRNLGTRNARGQWLVFIDADSVLMPYFMDRLQVYIEAAKPMVFTTWMQPDSDVNNDAIFTLFTNIFIESMIVFKRPFTPGPLTVIAADIFRDVGGYDETHAFNEDVEFGLRLAKRGVTLRILRETLYIWSMRRIRRESKLKLMQQYVLSALPIFFLKRPMKYMPGYVMGGQLYGKKKRIKQSVLVGYERKLKQLKQLMQELFA